MKPCLIEVSLPRDGNAPRTQTGARKTRSVLFNVAESPLGWLYARRLLSDRQYAAGEMLRRDYERAALPQRTTMVWDAPPTSKVARGSTAHGAVTLAQIDAKRRFEGAVAVAGRGLADVMWRVVCAGEALPSAEKALGWPARAGRLVLTLALDRIADYYRIN